MREQGIASSDHNDVTVRDYVPYEEMGSPHTAASSLSMAYVHTSWQVEQVKVVVVIVGNKNWNCQQVVAVDCQIYNKLS